MTDAMLFLMIISVASALSLMGLSGSMGGAEIRSHYDMKEYAEDSYIALMRSTQDLAGCGMNQSALTLLDYALLRTSEEDGMGDSGLTVCDGLVYNSSRALIVGGYDFAITSSYRNTTSGRVAEIAIPRSGPFGEDRVQVGWDYPMICFGKEGHARICLVLWLR